MFIRLLFLGFFSLTFFITPITSEPKNNVQVTGETISIDNQKQVVWAQGNVILTYKNSLLFSEEFQYPQLRYFLCKNFLH